jgi:maleate cis-trans isomerase
MKKKYIGMAWPSDGINDSEYWNYLPKKYELLISRYPVSGSLKVEILKKESNLSNIMKCLKTMTTERLDTIILCDFGSSVLNGQNFINKVNSTVNFIKKRKKKISIISPYNKVITKSFLKLIPNKDIISSTVNLSLKSEIEINTIENFINLKNNTIFNNDLLFIGGGITISNLTNYYKNKFNIKIFSSPMLIINDAVFKIK